MYSLGGYIKLVGVKDTTETIDAKKYSTQDSHNEAKLSFSWILAEPKFLNVFQCNISL